VKALKRAIMIVAGISILYIAVHLALFFTQYSFRTWANVLGVLISVVILPLLCIIYVAKRLGKYESISAVVKAIAGVVTTIIYLLWIYMLFLFYILTVEDEVRASKHLLVVNDSGLARDVTYEYYRPVALFFRTPVEWTDEVKKEHLQDKYHREFELLTGTSAPPSTFFDKKLPTVNVTVYQEGNHIKDNYAENLCRKYLEDGILPHSLSRSYEVSDIDGNGSMRVYLKFDGKEDITALAEDAALLMTYVTEHSNFFKKQSGTLGFCCGEGEDEIRISLSFGKISAWENEQKDYYLYPEKVAEAVLEKYERALE